MYDNFIQDVRNLVNQYSDLLFDNTERKGLTKFGYIFFVVISCQFLDAFIKSLNELKKNYK